MVVDADRAALSFASTWQAMAQAAEPPMWHRALPGAVAMVSELPIPTLNGTWVHGRDVGDGSVRQLLREVAEHPHPYCLQCRPWDADRLASIADDLGMTAAGEVPMMTLDISSAEPTRSSALDVREVSGTERDIHVDVAARGFGAPTEVFASLLDRLGPHAGMRVYVGEVDGTAVTTGIGVQGDDGAVAVFNIATPPEHQGHGYGAAITAAVLDDAHRLGATWAWLQATEQGYGVYQRLGFQEVERWPTWVALPA
jgi:GNAT superfamily N-acetyltransferase